MAKIIVLGAMKGGVGKSVSTYNLAYSLKKLGKNVLVVDFDSSANITRCVVEDIKTVEISIGDLMMNQMDEEEQPNPAEYIINRNGVDFIPSSKVLSAVDAKLRLEMGAEKILACILEPLREKYDYILIDTCPSLNTLTINALAAADEVIIAANPQFWAMVGLEDFLLTVKKIKSRVNSKLDVSGILLTMCEERTNLCKVITDEVAEAFNGKLRIFDSKIPTTVKVGESVYYGEPFFTPKAGKAKMEVIDEGDDSKKSYKRLHRWRYSPTVAYGNNEVHLHPYKTRRLSAAEALSLQTLPKEFVLPTEMTLTDKFKTIGNGVPYILSSGIARTIYDFLEDNQ